MTDTITITGNLATAPTEQQTGSGDPYTRFRLASPNRRRDARTGEWVDLDPNWYTVLAFRSLASHAVASLEKGQRVIVTGALKVRRWEREGKTGTEVEVVADALGADLRFGTTRFSRAAPAAGAASAEGQGAAEAPPADWEAAPVAAGDGYAGETPF
ncbi:single-stranded DNA-binding protein [Microbacterium excoecariae]|uniref:single-stranded DNA-binding protein n=1 Tax=Microbacterium excoecariae TaxID=2715210 RepID=UPI00140D84DB|nr:single-stranded DNA-binding protein [Microbacterium excoecariae]NHI16936.1 single-stranded DNA-binding protein [Microbacterium excoecariae]